MENETGCCPRFDPKPWDGKTFKWKNKLFVKDHITALFHIPINFGKVITRVWTKVKKAKAEPKQILCLSDEKSPWGSDLYVAVTKKVPGGEVATISGTFLAKVFEGPFKDMKQWIAGMDTYVAAKKKKVKKLYFFYTTCPKCAKYYGKNYVVLFAKV